MISAREYQVLVHFPSDITHVHRVDLSANRLFQLLTRATQVDSTDQQVMDLSNQSPCESTGRHIDMRQSPDGVMTSMRHFASQPADSLDSSLDIH